MSFYCPPPNEHSYKTHNRYSPTPKNYRNILSRKDFFLQKNKMQFCTYFNIKIFISMMQIQADINSTSKMQKRKHNSLFQTCKKSLTSVLINQWWMTVSLYVLWYGGGSCRWNINRLFRLKTYNGGEKKLWTYFHEKYNY